MEPECLGSRVLVEMAADGVTQLVFERVEVVGLGEEILSKGPRRESTVRLFFNEHEQLCSRQDMDSYRLQLTLSGRPVRRGNIIRL